MVSIVLRCEELNKYRGLFNAFLLKLIFFSVYSTNIKCNIGFFFIKNNIDFECQYKGSSVSKFKKIIILFFFEFHLRFYFLKIEIKIIISFINLLIIIITKSNWFFSFFQVIFFNQWCCNLVLIKGKISYWFVTNSR